MPRNQSTGGPEFARALNNLMKQADMTQAEVAKSIEVWDSLVSRWRNGGGIELSNVRALADLFGVAREPLETLAGFGASPLASTQTNPADQLEREYWHKWYDSLREERVPRWAWTAYTAACNALGDYFASVEAPSTPSKPSGSTPSKQRPSRGSGPSEPRRRPNSVLDGILPVLAIRNS